MMGQRLKPLKEILHYLDGKKKIVLMGCGGCATVFHTGGEADLEKMANTLSKEGKEVLAQVKLPSGVFACHIPTSSRYIRKYIDEIRECDAILMMACGSGLQAIREYLEKRFNIFKPIYPAVDSLGFFGGGPTKFAEKCQGCGDCILAYTAGICPLTKCPKGLLNGPCGGVRPDGKCEVDPEEDCVWIKIYERLKKLGELEMLSKIMEPKDWSEMKRPRKLEVELVEDKAMKGGRFED